ncbi:hypothetical protein TTHERM_000083478 (macronuclear) [Tetrahymena thermophila SB210]|uniref:Uncharacterized protein n=1 Tax=Tetrahymena thermophila (strain SB210) TaxID=312017 RepID=W7XJ70_TETTS|nr:hypothetical protein TTHERM_000083478 [Tetrahymena thermophila SB210]EWS75261.1 hypothetical protein TTHERM_000083478 [Tetrahymena thermophila SB210]|eukprot:XP_012652252.1 hypothetical protein TTHERM_000083478 [Tetrahymena thermophila SB210]
MALLPSLTTNGIKLYPLIGQVFIILGLFDNTGFMHSFETIICPIGQYLNQQRQNDNDLCSPYQTICDIPNPKNICYCDDYYYQKSTQYIELKMYKV